MFDPEVEARFRRIDDILAVTARMLEVSEAKAAERLEALEAFQDFATKVLADHDHKLTALIDAQLHTERALAELAETMNRFLKTHGGHN